MLVELVGQPGHARGRVVEDTGGNARFLNRFVLVEQGRYPAQVNGIRFRRVAADHHAAVGGIIGDCVNDGAAFKLDVRVEDLECGNNIFGCSQYVEN